MGQHAVTGARGIVDRDLDADFLERGQRDASGLDVLPPTRLSVISERTDSPARPEVRQRLGHHVGKPSDTNWTGETLGAESRRCRCPASASR